ncbi:hypothetical protein D3C81_1922130 [compost metagenome]
MGRLCRKVEISGTAFRIEAEICGNRLQQGGLACPVFPHEKSNLALKINLVNIADDGQAERVTAGLRDTALFDSRLSYI